MNIDTFKSILAIGETIAVEFKRCGNGIEYDTYETVCSFLNRFGGDIFMGVLNLEPNPKNPIIAAFFRNIGHSDQLGSGVRNLFKYTKFYSGQIPELIEGDIFRITVPLNDKYSFDYEIGSGTTEKTTDKLPIKLTPTEKKILEIVSVNPNITQAQLATNIGITSDGIRYAIKNLKAKGILSGTGSRKNGSWTIIDS